MPDDPQTPRGEELRHMVSETRAELVARLKLCANGLVIHGMNPQAIFDAIAALSRPEGAKVLRDLETALERLREERDQWKSIAQVSATKSAEATLASLATAIEGKAGLCDACRGQGVVTKTYDDYGMADPKDVPCPKCRGCGRTLPLDAILSLLRETTEETK